MIETWCCTLNCFCLWWSWFIRFRVWSDRSPAPVPQKRSFVFRKQTSLLQSAYEYNWRCVLICLQMMFGNYQKDPEVRRSFSHISLTFPSRHRVLYSNTLPAQARWEISIFVAETFRAAIFPELSQIYWTSAQLVFFWQNASLRDKLEEMQVQIKNLSNHQVSDIVACFIAQILWSVPMTVKASTLRDARSGSGSATYYANAFIDFLLFWVVWSFFAPVLPYFWEK